MSRGAPWTSSEHKRLRYLRDVEKLPWSKISLPGRTSKACEGEYHARRFAQLRNDPPREKPPRSEPKPKRGRPPLAASPGIERKIPPAACRADHLDALRERAELQLRIAERGLTAGWFGDPPPGRSALDQRVAASLPTLASSHVEPISSPRDDRELPGHARFPTFAQD